MILARTPNGYIPTYNIKKGTVLLNKGEWIEAESESTELPCYQVTFSDNTYTYVKHENIYPSACNIPIDISITDNATFTIGYCIQNNIKFPYTFVDKKILKGFMKINHRIPKQKTDRAYTVEHADLSHGYSNDDIANIVNGILHTNANITRYHNSRLVWNRLLTDEAMMYMHLASVETYNNECNPISYKNLFKILYSFNPTDAMMVECMKQPELHYTDVKCITSVIKSTAYLLPNQDIDINNFSSI